MSHSHGAVKFEDGLILFCEYNGTVDVMLPRLWESRDEVNNHWREKLDNWPLCNCGRSEKVRIASTYGRGFSWDGMACRYCKLITDFHEPDYNNETSGFPEWYPEKELWIGNVQRPHSHL